MTMGKKRGLKIALIIILLLVANAGAFAWIGVNFVKEKLDKVVKLEVDKSKLGIDPRVRGSSRIIEISCCSESIPEM